jgi:hypothetical protein
VRLLSCPPLEASPASHLRPASCALRGNQSITRLEITLLTIQMFFPITWPISRRQLLPRWYVYKVQTIMLNTILAVIFTFSTARYVRNLRVSDARPAIFRKGAKFIPQAVSYRLCLRLFRSSELSSLFHGGILDLNLAGKENSTVRMFLITSLPTAADKLHETVYSKSDVISAIGYLSDPPMIYYRSLDVMKQVMAHKNSFVKPVDANRIFRLFY